MTIYNDLEWENDRTKWRGLTYPHVTLPLKGINHQQYYICDQ